MKFITEEDLRNIYRKEPFTVYELGPGVRLTPGARQFLLDKRIEALENPPLNKKKEEVSEKAEQVALVPSDAGNPPCRNKKLYRCLKSAEASFLLAEEELLSRDVCLAQSVMALGKQLRAINKLVKDHSPVTDLECTECTGIKCSNFSRDLEECFEVTEFHMQLPKGREMAVLNKLRCELYELAESMEEKEEEAEEIRNIREKLFQIINSLSQLICSAFGGKKCLRKM